MLVLDGVYSPEETFHPLRYRPGAPHGLRNTLVDSSPTRYCHIGPAGLVVPKEGLEPTRPCGHYALNVARLPIPPLRHGGIARVDLRVGARPHGPSIPNREGGENHVARPRVVSSGRAPHTQYSYLRVSRIAPHSPVSALEEPRTSSSHDRSESI